MSVLDDTIDVRGNFARTYLYIDLKVVCVCRDIQRHNDRATVNPGTINGGWAVRKKRIVIWGCVGGNVRGWATSHWHVLRWEAGRLPIEYYTVRRGVRND